MGYRRRRGTGEIEDCRDPAVARFRRPREQKAGRRQTGDRNSHDSGAEAAGDAVADDNDEPSERHAVDRSAG